jgi:hypothetical protein
VIAVANDRFAALDQLSEAYERATCDPMRAYIAAEVERVRRDVEFFEKAKRPE